MTKRNQDSESAEIIESPSGLTFRHVAILLVAAIVLWAGVWWWQSQQKLPAAQLHLEAGYEALQAGKGSLAESEWIKAVEVEPKNLLAWQALGDFYLSTRQMAQAQQAYAVVAKLEPETPKIWSRLARADAALGDSVAARLHVDEALKRDADDVNALNIYSTLLLRSGNTEKRGEVLQHLAKLQPDNVTIVTKAADDLMRRRRYEEAAPLVERLLQLQPDSTSAYAMRGAMAFERSVKPEALRAAMKDFQKAIELNAANWVARWYLGRAYLRLNQNAAALRELKAVDAMGPADKNYLNDLAVAYQRTGDATQATALRRQFATAEQEQHKITELTKRLALEPDNFETNLQLGLLLLRSKNAGDASPLLNKALSLKPQNARAQQAVGELNTTYEQNLAAGLKALSEKNQAQAISHLSRAFALRPDDARTEQAIQKLAALAGASYEQALFAIERLSR